jgi:hypothetical protein
MSLVIHSSLISVHEGEGTGYRRIFKPWDNWDMDCVCVLFRVWMGKRNHLSGFERVMVVGARRTGLCQDLQRYWVFHAEQFPVCIKNGPPPKGHPANLTQLWEALESTWASIPVERFWHLSVEWTNWGCSEGKIVCNSILEVGVPNVLYTQCIYSICFTFAIVKNLCFSSSAAVGLKDRDNSLLHCRTVNVPWREENPLKKKNEIKKNCGKHWGQHGPASL